MDGLGARGMGWQRDLRDPRDYGPTDPAVRDLFDAVGPRARARRLPARVDLREYFPPPEDQGTLNSSPAFVVLALVGYLEARTTGRRLDASRLFLYQMALKLLRLRGNAGVDLRTTFKALVRFGSPPEGYWPTTAEQAARDPADGFLFAYAREYESVRYFRVDTGDGAGTLRAVKACLAGGLVTAFGFAVPSSLMTDADVPYRPQFDGVGGGHAVLAVGYDDHRRIASDTGALLFRNSWGPGWGERGYGWLPYAFVTSQAATDFWAAVHPGAAASGAFSCPAGDTS